MLQENSELKLKMVSWIFDRENLALRLSRKFCQIHSLFAGYMYAGPDGRAPSSILFTCRGTEKNRI